MSDADISVAPLEDESFKRFEVALAADIPTLYANGFLNVQTPGDVATVFERNGRPVAILNMSFTTAKSYLVYLGQLIATLEQKSGRDIMTSDDVNRSVFVTSQEHES